jgi:hypothetical protein
MGSGVDVFVDLAARVDAGVAADRHIRGQDLLLPVPDFDLALLTLGPCDLGSARGLSGLNSPVSL